MKTNIGKIKSTEMTCELIDPATKIERMTVVKVSGGQISIHIEGFGDNASGDNYGEPIVIDLHDNKLQVFLWGDINDEDITHSIDMTGAMLDKRVEDHNKVMETQDDA
jgi:hypothetical protein